jgi:hypothetical protein
MQSPPPGAPLPAPPWGPPKTNGTALVALSSSLAGFVCLFGLGGALGVVLGLIGRREIARSDGREAGRGLANAAIALGVLNAGFAVIAVAMGITALVRPKPIAAVRAAPTPTWTAPASSSKAARPSTPPARSSRERGDQLTHLGALTLVDISGNFEEELAKQRGLADAASQVLILWLVVPNCKPCDGVAAALASPITQKALARVRLVRVDRDQFEVELQRLSIPTEKIPGFALLDRQSHPRDFIHGGEWDADIAANIAPILGKFAHGELKNRRQRWVGPARDDETPL